MLKRKTTKRKVVKKEKIGFSLKRVAGATRYTITKPLRKATKRRKL